MLILSFYSNYKLKSFLMPADTSIESLEPIQLDIEKDVDTSSTIPSPQPGSLSEKILSLSLTIHLIVNSFTTSNKTPFVHI